MLLHLSSELKAASDEEAMEIANNSKFSMSHVSDQTVNAVENAPFNSGKIWNGTLR